MDVTIIAWLALLGGIIVLLLIDLFVLHRGAHEISIRNAAWSTGAFVAISIGFGALLWVIEGRDIGAQFFAGYLLEYSLSLDNVFVWALVFGAFSVPAAYQHRVLFYGIFGALLLRGAFVAAGSELLARFEWVVYVFGALLLWSGVRMLRGHREIDPNESFVVKALRKNVPTTRHLAGAHLFVRAHRVPDANRPARKPLLGRWYATPLLAVLAIIEFSDVIFAVDSIPAIFGVTREPFIVFSATALALVGLRSMYFLLAGMRGRFPYLDAGLAVILMFIGAKFMLSEIVHIGVGISLLVIVGVMTVSIAASLRSQRAAAPDREAPESPAARVGTQEVGMSEIDRLLVLAGAAVADMDELPPSVRTLLDAADRVLVVTPPLPSRLEWLMSDTDRARHEADERLGRILDQLSSTDIPAQGAVGDDTPLTLVDDHVRAFQPDHILVALRSSEHASWQERGLLEQIAESSQLPMTVFEIDENGRARDRSPA